MLVNGGAMIQTNLYDASKYTKKENADNEMKLVSDKFKDKKFAVIPIDQRIFGDNPRWVEDL
jgi:hypothetical protein